MLSGTSSEGLSDPSFMASDHPASLVCLSDLADSDNPTLLSFAELVQFSVFLSSFFVFALLVLFTSFLGPDEIHLTNTLVPMIALSLDHQNHSKWS